MADRPQWAPAEVDLDRPSVARSYDVSLGGSHDFEFPEMRALSRDSRDFPCRAVRHLCAAGGPAAPDDRPAHAGVGRTR